LNTVRKVFLLGFCFITAGWGLAGAFAAGFLEGESVFGICGFEQVHGLPCPFCSMTSAFVLFAKGRFAASFAEQPAGFMLALLSIVLWCVSLYALSGAGRLKRAAALFTKRRIVVAVLLMALFTLAVWLWKITQYRL
jgi:hypothetical protein